ncbi:Hypothetical protein MVR_LOCUS121 [uncultured virus]|nr:Hypothetical protein MVR_LOCUS121 [uncultured virus]
MPATVNDPDSSSSSSSSYYTKLRELVTLYGIKLSQSYTPDSDPEAMQLEYVNQIKALDADDSTFIADSLYAALLSLPFF